MSSSIVAPAADQVGVQFGTHSSVVIAFTTSIFVFAFGEYLDFIQRIGLMSDLKWVAIGPLFLSPLSETYGRSPVLQLANIWYLGV